MINKQKYERLLKQLDDIQKQIDEIHQELLIDNKLSEAEKKEIEAIRKENDYRTFDEWDK
jgi:CHAD domain-containing protein